jgi:hypothetical protein
MKDVQFVRTWEAEKVGRVLGREADYPKKHYSLEILLVHFFGFLLLNDFLVLETLVNLDEFVSFDEATPVHLLLFVPKDKDEIFEKFSMFRSRFHRISWNVDTHGLTTPNNTVHST